MFLRRMAAAVGYVALALAAYLIVRGVMVHDVASAEPLAAGIEITRLLVFKSDHRMEAYAGERLVKTYSVVIGSGGQGPKLYEGDRRTPEGVYQIDERHPSDQFYRFLHVSYPNDHDRRRYRDAQARGLVPDGRSIGSAIGVHGANGLAALVHELGIDSTAGCISVSNSEIEELYRAVVPDAIIDIRP